MYLEFKKKILGFLFKPSKSLPKITERITSNTWVQDICKHQTIKLRKIVFSRPTTQTTKLSNVNFEKCLFSGEQIDNFYFKNCKFTECLFHATKIINCQFHECTFENCSLYKASIIQTYLNPKSFVFSRKWKTHWANINTTLFQELYKNSRSSFQESFAMHADKQFQYYLRHVNLIQKGKIYSYLKSYAYGLFLGYGYGIINSLVTTAAVILTFSYLIQDKIKSNSILGYIDALYFTVVSFSTTGYGDYTPERSIIATTLTTAFILFSFIWGSVVTAIIVKRIVK